jgi:hypothetical protein
MWFDGPLASLSVGITYFLQVVLVYLTLRPPRLSPIRREKVVLNVPNA